MWKDAEEDYIYKNIDEAILTCCPLCGERIEWTIKLGWNDYSDRPVFSGLGFSCGLVFKINYNHKEDGYEICITKT